MSRVTLLLVLAAGMAIHAGASAAQPVELPDCRLKEKAQSLVAGTIPDFAGCVAEQVQSLVARVRPDIHLQLPSDATVPGAQPRLVTGQVVRGNTLTLVVPSRAGLQPPVGQDPAVVGPASTPVGPDPGTSILLPPPVEMPRFSISGSPRVTEGEPLIFQITREGDDGMPHRVDISYNDTTFLVDPPEWIDFPAGESSIPLQVTTADDPAENGDRPVIVRLMAVQGGRVADQSPVTGTIVDAPAASPEAVAYSIGFEGPATRGQPITFVVSRNGPLAAAEIVYDVTPARRDAPESGGAGRILFGQGVSNRTIIVPPQGYDLCGDPVTVTLQRGSSEETARNVEFTEFTPPECVPEPSPWEKLLNWLNTNLPWWPLIAAVLVAVVLGWTIRKLFDGGGNGPDRLPPVTAKCKIDHAPGKLGLDSASVGRWPPVRALVKMECGTGPVPSPLPIMEPRDG